MAREQINLVTVAAAVQSRTAPMIKEPPGARARAIRDENAAASGLPARERTRYSSLCCTARTALEDKHAPTTADTLRVFIGESLTTPRRANVDVRGYGGRMGESFPFFSLFLSFEG